MTFIYLITLTKIYKTNNTRGSCKAVLQRRFLSFDTVKHFEPARIKISLERLPPARIFVSPGRPRLYYIGIRIFTAAPRGDITGAVRQPGKESSSRRADVFRPLCQREREREKRPFNTTALCHRLSTRVPLSRRNFDLSRFSPPRPRAL